MKKKQEETLTVIGSYVSRKKDMRVDTKLKLLHSQLRSQAQLGVCASLFH